jgi:hypothetical protein
MNILFSPEELARKVQRWPRRERAFCQAMRRDERMFRAMIGKAAKTRRIAPRKSWFCGFFWEE